MQVEPIRRRLLERERRLKGEEEELKALEATLDVSSVEDVVFP